MTLVADELEDLLFRHLGQVQMTERRDQVSSDVQLDKLSVRSTGVDLALIAFSLWTTFCASRLSFPILFHFR